MARGFVRPTASFVSSASKKSAFLVSIARSFSARAGE
jgi:hypothetical protein